MGHHFLLPGSSQPRDWTHVSCIDRWILYYLSHQGNPSKRLLKRFTSLWGRERIYNYKVSKVSTLGKAGSGVQSQEEIHLKFNQVEENMKAILVNIYLVATHSNILAWRIPWTIHQVKKSWTRLSDFHSTFNHSNNMWPDTLGKKPARERSLSSHACGWEHSIGFFNLYPYRRSRPHPWNFSGVNTSYKACCSQP